MSLSAFPSRETILADRDIPLPLQNYIYNNSCHPKQESLRGHYSPYVGIAATFETILTFLLSNYLIVLQGT